MEKQEIFDKIFKNVIKNVEKLRVKKFGRHFRDLFENWLNFGKQRNFWQNPQNFWKNFIKTVDKLWVKHVMLKFEQILSKICGNSA